MGAAFLTEWLFEQRGLFVGLWKNGSFKMMSIISGGHHWGHDMMWQQCLQNVVHLNIMYFLYPSQGLQQYWANQSFLNHPLIDKSFWYEATSKIKLLIPENVRGLNLLCIFYFYLAVHISCGFCCCHCHHSSLLVDCFIFATPPNFCSFFLLPL